MTRIRDPGQRRQQARLVLRDVSGQLNQVADSRIDQ